MSKKFVFLFTILVIATTMLAACQPAATTVPTTAPAEPTASAPQPTTAVAEPTMAPAEPTAAPTVAAPSGPTGEVTLWHSYHTGENEEKALTQLITQFQTENPKLKVNVLAIPFDQIFNKWETEVAAGSGPDLFVAPNDSLGKEVRASLVQDLTGKLTADQLAAYLPVAIQADTIDGKLWAVPESMKAVALFYNKTTIPTPPATTDELMTMVKAGKKIVLNQNAYHNFGFFGAFGSKMFDATGKCIADTDGASDAIQYMVDLKKAGALFQTDGGKADTMFEQGQADMIINGPWQLGTYKGFLKDNLGVSAMPAGPKGPATPLAAPDGFYINPNSQNVDGALYLAAWLTKPASEQVFVDVAGHVPAQVGMTVADPLVKGFADASANGFPRPQTSWFDNYWTPFGDLITKALEGKVAAVDGVKQACADMNKANNIK
ncbi:MAG: extracellular solute-binding protein [Anaerolineaceae bacterium]|nr:extracellular solute-binding protein [Anaerolineaceae bacterium]